MIFPKTNLEKKLAHTRYKQFDESSWEQQIKSIFISSDIQNDQILDTLNNKGNQENNTFIFDRLETNKIYHLDHIKNICINYRLRFLDSMYFKGVFPKEALIAIKRIEREHHIELKGFKIIAPSKLFKLANADDPLLFAPIGNNYYYLIHKWGYDLHPFRKLIMWFFKSLENLIVLTLLVSLLITFLVPNGLFSKENSIYTDVMLFLFIFKSVAAITIFYGFALGKNFNSAIWNSKYYNS